MSLRVLASGAMRAWPSGVVDTSPRQHQGPNRTFFLISAIAAVCRACFVAASCVWGPDIDGFSERASPSPGPPGWWWVGGAWRPGSSTQQQDGDARGSPCW